MLRRARTCILPGLALAATHAFGFLTLAPGIMAFTLNSSPQPLYAWGLDGGYHLPIGAAFKMQFGGFFEHLTNGPGNFVRFGGIGRFGGGNETLFGYGLVRLGGDFFVARGFGGFGAFHASFGGGVMGMVHRVVGLGGEVAFDVLARNGAAGLMRLRFFITLKF